MAAQPGCEGFLVAGDARGPFVPERADRPCRRGVPHQTGGHIDLSMYGHVFEPEHDNDEPREKDRVCPIPPVSETAS